MEILSHGSVWIFVGGIGAMVACRKTQTMRPYLLIGALCGLLAAKSLAAEPLESVISTAPTTQAVMTLTSRLPQLFEANSAQIGSRVDEIKLLSQQGEKEDSDLPSSVATPRPLKSPQRSLLYSALIPGAGEFYAGAKKRAALFFGLEAIGWGMYFRMTGKGNDIEKEFRATANEHWDVDRYALWAGGSSRSNPFIHHALPCSTYAGTGSLSDCPDVEKQQYYELIGKYDQFVAGWKDIHDSTGTIPLGVGDISDPGVVTSQERLDYEIKRDDSNRYLKRATNIAGLILVNHVFSAIDAARAARATANGADKASLQRRMRFAFFRGGGSGKTPMIVAYKPIH